MIDEDLRWCDVCDDCSHYKAVGDEKYQCTLEGGRCRGYFAYKKLKAENAALQERLERSIELPVPLGETGLCIRKIDLWEDDSPRPLKHGLTWVMTEETYTMEDISDFEKLWFPNTTAGRKTAEARLNELGGWMKNGQ